MLFLFICASFSRNNEDKNKNMFSQQLDYRFWNIFSFHSNITFKGVTAAIEHKINGIYYHNKTNYSQQLVNILFPV